MFETLQKYGAENFDVQSAQEKKQVKRGYNASRLNRLTQDWVFSHQVTNQMLRADLRRLRERSRDICRNDPYAKRYLSLMKNNVVGRGTTLQIRPSGKTIASDAKLSKQIETAWYEWGKKQTCTASGKLSWRGVQQLFIKNLVRDGEVVLRKIYDRKNKFGFSLKFYNAQWLDETYNETLPNGNRVIMSVEVDDFDRPVAYHLTQPAGDYQRRSQTRYRQRVEAEDIIHAFVADEDEEQTRGVPWLHASMLRLKMFDGYEEAELVGKRVEACNMGFFVPPQTDTQTLDDEDSEGNQIDLIQSAQPGMFVELPPDYELKTFEPKSDNNNSDFKKTALRGVAAGGDVSYHSLAGDLEAVNYSSAKIGGLEERENYKNLQDFLIEDLCEPVFADWLAAALLSGALDISLKDFERVKTPFFRARGWTWVEPLKESSAARIGLEDKTTTLTDILAEKGIDIEDHFETLKKEKELAEKYGIDLVYGKQQNESQNADAEEPKARSAGARSSDELVKQVIAEEVKDTNFEK